MAEFTPILGAGVTLGYTTTLTGSSFTTLNNLIDVSLPKQKVASVKASTYLSPNQVHLKQPGWADSGSIDAEVQYNETQTAAIQAMFRILTKWQITLPDTHTATFDGFISAFDGKVPNEDLVTTKFSVEISGPVTWA